METIKIDNCQLEIDPNRNVIYVHSPKGITALRVSILPGSQQNRAEVREALKREQIQIAIGAQAIVTGSDLPKKMVKSSK